ncbi:MAG TPA: hypothetical protein VMZ50_09925 [Phycisphaerae bacterium]|nr:hypothetical protein [Phycisphaerae bacterium]
MFLDCEGCGYPTPAGWWQEWGCNCLGCGDAHLICADCGFGWGTPTMENPTWTVLLACPTECAMAEEVAGKPANPLGRGVEAAYRVMHKTAKLEVADEATAQRVAAAVAAMGLPVHGARIERSGFKICLRLADGREVVYP